MAVVTVSRRRDHERLADSLENLSRAPLEILAASAPDALHLAAGTIRLLLDAIPKEDN